MPEPTDHRALAEFWVNQFHDRIGPVNPEPRDMLLLAHIHALLAVTETALPEPYKQPNGGRGQRTVPWQYDPKTGTASADLGPQKVTFTALRADQCGAVWDMPDADHRCRCQLKPGHMNAPTRESPEPMQPYHLCQTGRHSATESAVRYPAPSHGSVHPPLSPSEG